MQEVIEVLVEEFVINNTKKIQKKLKVTRKSAYHHGNMNDAIIITAANLIKEKKSLDFQLKDIAKIINTSTPAIYRHFENKQDLLVKAAIFGYDLQKKYRDLAFEVHSETPLHKLMAIGFAYIHFSRLHPGFFMLMKNLETKEILSSQGYINQRDFTQNLVRGLIDECINNGIFINDNKEMMITFLQSTTYGIAQMFLLESMPLFAPTQYDDPNFVSQILRHTISSLLTDKGKLHLDDANKNPFIYKLS